ncbi:tRNA pseudouridine synthase 10 [Methanohalophilus levihalophilus]|uniref:tRNA pseudouridine(54/55) synthase Pus10 n=1 Tax=Methanohalophilus levihalophilus TaxID=1431282 RepID=UPI001AEAB179|nr:tRNA pseudouridine(54/55) synthase Pus10 [Methanohalophilus levihalophilus]MBP2029539.1 tRNA pseudouridine synthase 10 [Methanohalophilus levihalophilus]
MSILEIAKKILPEGPICDHCMGRQFANLSTGLTNDERGRAVKLALAMEADKLNKDEDDKSLLEQLSPSSRNARLSLKDSGKKDEQCWVCLGIFDRVEEWADRALKAVEEIEYSTFVVGTKVSGLLSENEEILWAESGTTYGEPIKSEINREVGKLIAAKSGKEVDIKNPDVVITLDIAKEVVYTQIRSIYIAGRYRKFIRGIPQTRWPCRSCRGRGCEKCNQTGQQYPESVDELIRGPVIKATNGEDTRFHGSGREDIDALMLGTGRPFVVEALSPKIRTIDVAAIQDEINRESAGKVEVEGLKLVSKDLIHALKSSKADKVYKLKVTFSDPVPENTLRSAVEKLTGSRIEQRTPNRVSHRRADLVRERNVHSMELLEYHDEYSIFKVDCQGGLYVKELVSGDENRTSPSLTGLIGVQALVEELDVIDVKIDL